jgi:hypothetical protein
MKPDGHYLFPWIAAEGWQIQLLTAQTPWASSPSSPAPGRRFLRHSPMKAEAALAHPHAIRATIRAAFSAANFAFHMNDERACDSRYRGSAVILLHCGGRGGEPPGGCVRRIRGICIGRALKCDLAVRRTIAMNDIVGRNTCDNSRGSSARLAWPRRNTGKIADPALLLVLPSDHLWLSVGIEYLIPPSPNPMT